MQAKRSILYIEKSLLKRQRQPILRGMELFDLLLIRDLLAAGCPVTLPVVRCWEELIRPRLDSTRFSLMWVPDLGGSMQNSLLAAGRVRRHDALLLGNVGNGIVPAVHLLFRTGKVPQAALIAGREASPRFVRALRRYPLRVAALNRVIAEPFQRAGYPLAQADYGIPNAADFHPPAGPKPESDPVDFCVLGQLDNAWKGADTALAAFRQLPPEVRRRCRLHLASYLHPPAIADPGVVLYPWLPPEKIPGFLRKMDVILVPSRDEEVMRETFCQAMVQGMLTGLPVIANDLPVLTEKLDEGGGLIFRSVEEFAGHMAALAADPALRRKLGAEARKVALTRYVWDTGHFIRTYLFPEP